MTGAKTRERVPSLPADDRQKRNTDFWEPQLFRQSWARAGLASCGAWLGQPRFA